jgi:FkbM family methyltransferase
MRLPEELGGGFFRCDLRDSIAREVCFTGRYEPQETALVRALLGPGMSFVDVGANWGYFTLLAAHQVGKSGRVISLEPDPRLFPVLADNIAVNHLSQVTALQVAAGSESGSLTLAGFDEAGDNFGLSRVVGQDHANGLLFQVAARPLDAVFPEMGLATVDLVKLDVEGAEGLALEGLRESLAGRRVRRLLLELHPAQLAEHGQNPSELHEQLRQFGYQPWKIDHSERVNRWAAYQSDIDLNRVLRPLEAAAALDRWPHILWVLQGMEPL